MKKRGKTRSPSGATRIHGAETGENINVRHLRGEPMIENADCGEKEKDTRPASVCVFSLVAASRDIGEG